MSWVTNSTVLPVLVPDAQQFVLQRLARHRVERAEGLVHQQHLGIDRQRAGERHALALAARQLVRVPVGVVGEADQRQRLAGAVAAARRGAGRSAPARTPRWRARAARAAAAPSWNTSATGSTAPAVAGAILTVPALGLARSAITRSSVDLPTPDGPTMARNSPRRTVRSSPRSTSVRRPLRSKARPSRAM